MNQTQGLLKYITKILNLKLSPSKRTISLTYLDYLTGDWYN